MKKILTFALSIVMLLSGSTMLFGCGDNDGLTKIRLSEVTHSIFYAPFYLAINKGYFEEENIKIELSNGGGADKVMAAIASKSADIGLMGPEATIYCHIEGQRDYPVIFGQLTQRDGSFLVGRNAEPNFEWSSLEGKHILAGRPGGMPAMTLQYVMNQAGVDTDTPLFDTSVPFNNIVGAFEGDTKYDYCTMFEPLASEYVAAGKGHIVASVGEASGDVPYTAFSASKSYLSENKELVTAFLRAVMKGHKFMTENTATEVAKFVAPSFEGTPLSSIEASIKNYLDINTWCPTPAMSETMFNNLQVIMENAGTLPTRADYNLAVDNTIANSLS